MVKNLHVNSNIANKQGYGGFEENSFDKIDCRVTHSLGHQKMDMNGLEAEVTGVGISHECGCVSNCPRNVGMYSANDANHASTPYGKDFVLIEASSYKFCQ